MERYHRKLAKILDGQFSVEKEQVQGEIAALQEQLQAVRGQIRELGFVGSVSKEFLDRHSELKGRIDALKLQNEAYLTLLDLQDARKKADNMLKSAITSILADIEHDVNAKMKEFNDSFYEDARKAPRLHFNNYNSYTFETPDDSGASNVYFAVTRSAISIPPWINPLYNLIDEHLRDIEQAKKMAVRFGKTEEDGLQQIYEEYFSTYTREEFDEAYERRMNNIREFTEIKRMEYEAITHHDDPTYQSNKKHFKAEEDPLPGYFSRYFKRIIRITRLREVRVLLGFTRVDSPDPDADDQPNNVYLTKGRDERWFPAVEVNGEGIFIDFNRQTLAKWLTEPKTREISEKYAASYREYCESKGWTIKADRNAVYVLMHTFSHLLIKQMSMSSGYSSSAIRERIYFGDKMAGILLYTGSSDKEGSLGGLVELGTADQMTNLMRDAFQEALVCTNDPECMNTLPAGKNSNGAACHSCCMISETACENGNRMLDRGLVVPLAGREETSYFRELVNELCQVEI